MESYPPEVLKRLQETELEILDVVARVCEEHGITWFLDSGTLLGAVRHGGFIPWDDDMDIGMVREDYERFLEVAPHALPDGYTLITPDNTPSYAAFFAKVYKEGTKFYTQETIDAGFDQGIFIDIFPFDYVYKDKTKQGKQYREAQKYTRMSYLYHSPHVSKKFSGALKYILPACFQVAHKILRVISSDQAIKRKYHNATGTCTKEEAAGYTPFSYPYVPVFPEDIILPTAPIAFDSRTFPTPANVEAYLEKEFDETWRILPPEEERKSHSPLILDFGDGINALSD